ncbi:hypothetical protein K8353_31085 [Burkholderia contaminans]|nr:hypothetical protein [Burkholderia contaminans]
MGGSLRSWGQGSGRVDARQCAGIELITWLSQKSSVERREPAFVGNPEMRYVSLPVTSLPEPQAMK